MALCVGEHGQQWSVGHHRKMLQSRTANKELKHLCSIMDAVTILELNCITHSASS